MPHLTGASSKHPATFSASSQQDGALNSRRTPPSLPNSGGTPSPLPVRTPPPLPCRKPLPGNLQDGLRKSGSTVGVRAVKSKPEQKSKIQKPDVLEKLRSIGQLECLKYIDTDVASIAINKDAKTVFNFMSDPNKMDLWSFGTWRIRVDEAGVVQGQSLFDGSTAFVRIEPNQESSQIDYWVGSDSEHLVPRIFVSITSGEAEDSATQNCVMSMIALRSEEMNDERWDRLVSAHALEVQLIKSVLENDFDHRKLLGKCRI